MKTLHALFLCASLAACGGPASPAASGGPSAGYSDDHHHGHGKMSGPLHAFHEVLAPAWHSTPGKERIAKTCDGIDTMVERGKETKDSSLIALTARLKEECGDPMRDEVEAWLSKVHDRFHELADAR